jgi:hypothetical protein
MPSPLHQNFVLLFCKHPELTFELARRAGAPVPRRYRRFELASAEFEDPVTGTCVRADVAIIGHVSQRVWLGIVLEVQLDEDAEKEWTIEQYRAGIRRAHKCPGWAVVFSPEPKVRRSMTKRMFVREPEIRPFVVMPEMIPIVQTFEDALRNYAWAVLAAAVHNTGPHAVVGATVAIRALLRLAPEHYERYIQLVSASVGEQVMQQVREQLPPEEQIELSEFERRGSTYVRAHREGYKEGLDDGLEQGLEEGLQRGLQAALRTVLEVRGLIVDEQTQQRIAACSQPEALRELIARAATVTSAAELFSTAE